MKVNNIPVRRWCASCINHFLP